MKKRLSVLFTVLVLFAFGLFCACGKKIVQADENTVFITVTKLHKEDETLKEYMDTLAEHGDITFTVSDGMVTSINGKSNTQSSFWMLYTSDSENANEQWGVFEHEGNQYGSAILGATELKIKKDCVYVWTYQTF